MPLRKCMHLTQAHTHMYVKKFVSGVVEIDVVSWRKLPQEKSVLHFSFPQREFSPDAVWRNCVFVRACICMHTHIVRKSFFIEKLCFCRAKGEIKDNKLVCVFPAGAFFIYCSFFAVSQTIIVKRSMGFLFSDIFTFLTYGLTQCKKWGSDAVLSVSTTFNTALNSLFSKILIWIIVDFYHREYGKSVFRPHGHYT